MSVGVFDGALLHETIIPRFIRFCSSGSQSFGHNTVHFFYTGNREGEKAGNCSFGVRNGLGCEGCEFGVAEEHDKNSLAPDHTFSGIVGELGVVDKSQRRIKVERLLEVAYREVDEELFHGTGLTVMDKVAAKGKPLTRSRFRYLKEKFRNQAFAGYT